MDRNYLEFLLKVIFVNRKLVPIVAWFVLFVCHMSALQANNMHHFQFQTLSPPQYELKSNTITSIVQDDEVGFIWVGSRKGLFYYNGNDYREVSTVNRTLSSNLRLDITKLCFDQRGWLWIGTHKGILVYHPAEDKIIEIDNSVRLRNVIVRDLFASSSGDVLIGSRNHLFAYDSDALRIQDITPPIERDAPNTPYFFYSFCEGDDSAIWLSSSFGLLKYDNRSFDYSCYDFFPYEETYGTDAVSNQQILLKKTPEGNLLLGSEKGLYVLNVDNQTIKPYVYTIDNAFSHIRSLCFDHKDRLWIGTLNGILIAENDEPPVEITYNPEQSNSLTDNRILTMYADKNNTIWIGTYYGGVNYWNDAGSGFRLITDKPSNGLLHKTVNSISKDDAGNLYFGAEQKGISIYNTTTGTFKQNKGLNDFLSPLAVKDVLVNKQHIWVATLSGGLLYYNTRTASQKTYLIDESDVQPDLSFLNNIMSLQKESDTTLMLGTFHHGLNTFNTTSGEFKNIPLSAFKSPQKLVPAVQEIIKDKDGNTWVLAQDDVFQLTKNTSSLIGYDVKQIYNGVVEDGWIKDICITKEGELWFSCPTHSVFKYANGQLSKVDLGENVEVLSIVEGSENDLWMSTTRGIIQYNYNTSEYRLFDQSFGLSKNEFSPRAGISAPDGTMFFGGASGVTSFNPSDIEPSEKDSLRTIITNFLVYNKELTPDDGSGALTQPIAYCKAVTLNPHQNMFTIRFSNEDFALPQRKNFEYRLLGFNDNWIATSSSEVTYTLQSGGDYTFEVRNVNTKGLPSQQSTQLHITLLNPIWRTPWAYAFYFLILTLTAWVLFNLYRSKTKLKHQMQIDAIEHEKQKELNEQKLRFFTNISHDFRTPLALIIGSIDQFVKKFPLTSEMNQLLSGARKNSTLLMTLINDLMDFRKLENKQTNLSVSERDLVAFAHEVFLSFKNQAESKKIAYVFNTNVDSIPVYFDAQKLERVTYNLLSNAFKYTPKGGNVTLNILQYKTSVELIVKDSGPGIAPEHLPHIFDRFYNVKGENNFFIKGTGIGLAIAKNFVELHKGTLSVTSKLKEGSSFVITLPFGKSHLDPADIVEVQSELDLIKQSQQLLSNDEHRKITAIVEDVLQKKDKQYTVLIAEDNADLGLFLKETLRDYFNVQLEPNGLKAYQRVLNTPPDIIISDVMMPVMDGIEFCKKIKSNTDTSYIPFFMLTARTALVYKYAGLESGADEYLSKPFQVKELLLKCANTLKTQENFRKAFFAGNETETTNAKSNEDDYTRAMKILNSNISNDAFGVNDLCEKLGISRSVLYNKVKEWTGQSPGELMLGFRMKRAAILLEQHKYTVAQVANKVGYKQATYFTKCFKNYYNILPGDYAKKYRD